MSRTHAIRGCGWFVILNGGGTAVRDLTSAKSFDVVNGNARGACSLQNLCRCTVCFEASYGPSEGYRPPQDDNSGQITTAISLLGYPPANLVSIRRGPGGDTFRRRGSRVCTSCSSRCFRSAGRLTRCHSLRL